MKIEKWKSVGEKGTVAKGESRDELSDIWVGYRRPSGGANITPEVIVSGERLELRGNTTGRGETLTVETGEDVGPNDVGMDGVDGCFTDLLNG